MPTAPADVFVFWAMLGAGAPAERFGRSNPSRQIARSDPLDPYPTRASSSSRERGRGKEPRLAAHLRRPPHAPALSSPRLLAALAAGWS